MGRGERCIKGENGPLTRINESSKQMSAVKDPEIERLNKSPDFKHELRASTKKKNYLHHHRVMNLTTIGYVSMFHRDTKHKTRVLFGSLVFRFRALYLTR